MLPEIYESYVHTGKVELVFLDFPLQMHDRAFRAAEAAQCAGEQDLFWDMHHRIFGEGWGALADDDLVGNAEFLGADIAAFRACLDSGRHADGIRQDMRELKKARVTGTPAFLIGRRVGDTETVKVEKVVSGAAPYEALAKILDDLLVLE